MRLWYDIALFVAPDERALLTVKSADIVAEDDWVPIVVHEHPLFAPVTQVGGQQRQKALEVTIGAVGGLGNEGFVVGRKVVTHLAHGRRGIEILIADILQFQKPVEVLDRAVDTIDEIG